MAEAVGDDLGSVVGSCAEFDMPRRVAPPGPSHLGNPRVSPGRAAPVHAAATRASAIRASDMGLPRVRRAGVGCDRRTMFWLPFMPAEFESAPSGSARRITHGDSREWSTLIAWGQDEPTADSSSVWDIVTTASLSKCVRQVRRAPGGAAGGRWPALRAHRTACRGRTAMTGWAGMWTLPGRMSVRMRSCSGSPERARP